MDRRVVGWSAGRHVDHPCGGLILPWPARKGTEYSHFLYYTCKSIRPAQGPQTQNREKRGSESKKIPIFPHRQGRLESKNPHFPVVPCIEVGIFLTRDALFWGGRKWGFLDSEPLFSRFLGFFPRETKESFAKIRLGVLPVFFSQAPRKLVLVDLGRKECG